MPVATVNLVIKQGSVFHKGWTWTLPDPDDPTVPGTDVMDLTGYTARAQIRREQQDVDGMLSFTTENGKIVLGGDNDGHILIDLLATDTDLLNQKKMFWDLELIPPDGGGDPDPSRAFAIMQGKVAVIPNYTQTDGQEVVE